MSVNKYASRYFNSGNNFRRTINQSARPRCAKGAPFATSFSSSFFSLFFFPLSRLRRSPTKVLRNESGGWQTSSPSYDKCLGIVHASTSTQIESRRTRVGKRTGKLFDSTRAMRRRSSTVDTIQPGAKPRGKLPNRDKYLLKIYQRWKRTIVNDVRRKIARFLLIIRASILAIKIIISDLSF